ncbi:sigma-54-dependent Fis family transcriptional regulator [Thermoactinomyces sp. Gus2-1]|uniref:sigma-54 interaction domain-containing protein n=1 Tax=Thermoactinomyces sp. Gus2-1 TaxID=1535750 RepID=UPI000A81E8B8|nr:sigma 54-interacting transcriptional regulator [Thermoactinomyces sp. Gus2-1]
MKKLIIFSHGVVIIPKAKCFDPEQLEQIAEIIEWIPDGVYVTNGSGVTLLVNSAYEKLSDTRREELIGRHMNDLIKEGYINHSVSLLVIEHKRSMSLMQNLRNGKEVIVTGNPVFDEAGEIQLVVTSVRDITRLNRLTEELEKVVGLSELNRHQYHLMTDGDNTFVSESKCMKEIIGKVKQVAPYPTNVLLLGPSGVGKEVIANLIHHLSDRRNKPFIKVNCAAIPEALLESELFGYEPGAFTGARKGGKKGLFELADGGTILLDEIGEMPLALQTKLLRVLQDPLVYRIGGIKARPVNVRVISSTNRDLRSLVKERRFRQDLFYRLQVVEIHIPPLSERPEDVPALIDFYFMHYSKKFRVQKRLSLDAKEQLCRYHWPGNVREIKNLMENLIVSVPSLVIELHHLPAHIQNAQVNHPLTLKKRVERYEQQLVLATIKSQPSLRQAAKVLGIDHSTLIKKLQRWNRNGSVQNIN